MSSGCGDVLSLADLQTAKKHQIFEAEVITGKSGGVASGADIDYATNAVTGQAQKTLPAVLRDAGFSPVSWDFSTGGTLTVNDRDKEVYDPVSLTWYSYTGALPVTVPAGFNPVGNADWKPRTDPNIRGDLSAADGLKLIGSCDSFEQLRNTPPSFAGQRIFMKGWHSGSLLGSGWFMAEDTTVNDNGGTVAGSGVLRWVKIETEINSYDFGALPDSIDFLTFVQSAFDASAYTKYTVNFTEDHALPVSSSVTVRSGTKVKWSNNKAYITLTADSGYGGVIALLGAYGGNSGTCQDVYLENPRVDGGNIGHPTGDTQGQNGISGANFVKNVRIVGGHIKNCARSSSAKMPEYPITGGKGVYFEYGAEDVMVSEVTAENCYIGFGGSGQELYGSNPGYCRRLQFPGCVCINCESALIVSRAYAGSADNHVAGYCDVKADIKAYNCGLGGSLSTLPATAFDRGLVIMDRAADCDVKVRLINLPDYGKIDSLLRGARMYNCKVDISANAETRTLFNNNAIIGGQINGVFRNNIISLSNIGDTDYAADMLSPDTQQRGNDVKLYINNPLTALLPASASGHGLMLELIRMDTNNPVQRIKGLAADIYRRFNSWALVPNGSLDLTGVSVGTNYTRTINRDGSVTIRFTVTMAAGGAAQVFNFPLALPSAATMLLP